MPRHDVFRFVYLTQMLSAYRTIIAGINTASCYGCYFQQAALQKCPDFLHETTDSVGTTDTPKHTADRLTFCIQTDTTFRNNDKTGKVQYVSKYTEFTRV
jgi:hypothetical protein